MAKSRLSLRFEALSEAHLPEILAIEKQSQGAPWSEQAFRNELTNPNSVFRVAMDKREVVAYGGIWTVVDEAHVTTITVDPTRRGQGIGEQLMVELLQRAIEEGMTCSTLEVRVSNEAAIKLYEKLGYVKVATRKRYYPDNREDALIMWLYELKDWSPPK